MTSAANGTTSGKHRGIDPREAPASAQAPSPPVPTIRPASQTPAIAARMHSTPPVAEPAGVAPLLRTSFIADGYPPVYQRAFTEALANSGCPTFVKALNDAGWTLTVSMRQPDDVIAPEMMINRATKTLAWHPFEPYAHDGVRQDVAKMLAAFINADPLAIGAVNLKSDDTAYRAAFNKDRSWLAQVGESIVFGFAATSGVPVPSRYQHYLETAIAARLYHGPQSFPKASEDTPRDAAASFAEAIVSRMGTSIVR
jgi:hypothetical protein